MTNLPTPLAERLEQLAGHVEPGPAPLSSMRDDVRRSRRRRSLTAAGGAAAAVLAVVIGVAVLAPGTRDAWPGPAANGEGIETAAPGVAQPGSVLYGRNGVAISVPKDWAYGDTRCGVPRSDTVYLDNPVCMAAVNYKPGVEGVRIGGAVRDPAAPSPGDLTSERDVTTCRELDQVEPLTLCTGSVTFPEQDVTIRVESTTDADTVDRLLAEVQLLNDAVAVPDPLESEGPPDVAGYSDQLRELGLEVETGPLQPERTVSQVTTQPPPGTVLEPGATVRITERRMPGAAR